MSTITYTAAREKLAETMDRVCDNHQPIVVTRQKQRSVVSRLEQAGPVLGRTGERTPGMSEELALEECLGDSTAIDRNERPRSPCRFLVDEPCDALLS